MEKHRDNEKLGPIYPIIANDLKMALNNLTLADESEVLDIGTSEGYSAITLACCGYRVETGEPETDQSRYAKKPWAENAAAMGVASRIHFRHFSADALPFDDNRFSAVFFLGVLHHIAEPLRKKSLQEALRVTRKNGAVVILEPSKKTLEKVWQNDPEHPLAANPTSYIPASQHQVEALSGKLMDVYIYHT